MERHTKLADFRHRKPWTTSTGVSQSLRPQKGASSIWRAAGLSAKPKMCCSSVHRASAKPIWPVPLVTRPSSSELSGALPFHLRSGPGLPGRTKPLTSRTRRCANAPKPDLVIIDDMGLKQLPKHSGEYLLEVIMRRYENCSTIMTSNRPLEEWGKLLCDVPTAGATTSTVSCITPRSSPSPAKLSCQGSPGAHPGKTRKVVNPATKPLAAGAAS